MKRIIVILCAVSLLITFMIIPAAATEVDSPSAMQPSFIDILSDTVSFQLDVLSGDEIIATYTYFNPRVSLSTLDRDIIWSWGDSSFRYHGDYYYVCIESDSVPVSVKLDSNVGSLVGVGDHYYFYKFTRKKITGDFQLFIDMGPTYKGVVAVTSAYCVIDDSISLDEVNFRTFGQFKSDGQYYLDNIFDQAVTLPFYYTKTYSSLASAPEQMFFDVNFPVPVPYADSVSVTFCSTNIWPNYYDQDTLSQGGVLLSRDGISEVLPYVVSDAVTAGTQRGYPMYIYTVTVDLSGYDLSDNTFLTFRSYVSFLYQNADTSNQSNFYFVALLDCSYKLISSNKPWYVRFFYWIRDEFTSLKEIMRESFGVGEDSSLTPDQEQSQDKIEQDKNDVDDQLQDIIDGLEEAPTVPDYDDTGLGEFKDQIDGNLSPVQPVFVVIFENPLVLQYVIYVFMFALGGFLLFGER